MLFRSHNVEAFDYDSVYDATTNFRYQPNVAGLYRIRALTGWEIGADQVQTACLIFQNASALSTSYPCTSSTKSAQSTYTETVVLMNGTSDYLDARGYQDSGGAANTYAGVTRTYLCGERIGAQA